MNWPSLMFQILAPLTRSASTKIVFKQNKCLKQHRLPKIIQSLHIDHQNFQARKKLDTRISTSPLHDSIFKEANSSALVTPMFIITKGIPFSHAFL